jgi:ribosomal-protein-alanine N-acetyltransferase
MQVYIETPRLIIRPIDWTDVDDMFAMDSDPAVHTYLGNTPYTDIEQSRENVSFIHQQYTENGIGRWAMLLKESDEFVGWVGFKLIKTRLNGHIDFHDFGYRMARKHWGKGLATEASMASLPYGVDLLQLKEVFATTDVGNTASRNVLEKVGFKFQHIFNYDDATWPAFYGKPTTWYKFEVSGLTR